MLTVGSLFSGIGGLDLGLEWAGLNVVWQCERDAKARVVLARHWPGLPIYDDVTTLRGADVAPVDALAGGFPCQDVSGAGKGAGLAGARSGLWREFRRLVAEIRPTYVIIENVASGKRRWLPFVRRDLRMLGYRTRAFALSAADVGAPHLRRRVFVLAANTERVELRDESRWGGGSRGEGAPVAGDHGEDGRAGVAGSDGFGVDAGPGAGPFPPLRGDGPGWERYIAAGGPEPCIRRSVDGVSSRLDGGRRRARLKQLGNAVVPQCAEVIGRMLIGLHATGNIAP